MIRMEPKKSQSSALITPLPGLGPTQIILHRSMNSKRANCARRRNDPDTAAHYRNNRAAIA